MLVISNVEDAAGLDKARAADITTQVIPHNGKTREAFDGEMDVALRGAQPDIVVLAGFMRILSDSFVRGWEGKLVNIHPSLLPAYKGTKVHERVIEARESLSGASVHFVVPVIAKATVPVYPDDTPQMLADRVLTVELKLYPEALKLLATGKVALKNGHAVFTA